LPTRICFEAVSSCSINFSMARSVRSIGRIGRCRTEIATEVVNLSRFLLVLRNCMRTACRTVAYRWPMREDERLPRRVVAPNGCNLRAIRTQYNVCNSPGVPGMLEGPSDHRLTAKDQSVFFRESPLLPTRARTTQGIAESLISNSWSLSLVTANNYTGWMPSVHPGLVNVRVHA